MGDGAGGPGSCRVFSGLVASSTRTPRCGRVRCGRRLQDEDTEEEAPEAAEGAQLCTANAEAEGEEREISEGRPQGRQRFRQRGQEACSQARSPCTHAHHQRCSAVKLHAGLRQGWAQLGSTSRVTHHCRLHTSSFSLLTVVTYFCAPRSLACCPLHRFRIFTFPEGLQRFLGSPRRCWKAPSFVKTWNLFGVPVTEDSHSSPHSVVGLCVDLGYRQFAFPTRGWFHHRMVFGSNPKARTVPTFSTCVAMGLKASYS